MISLPRIRNDYARKSQGEAWLIPAILVGYPQPGVGVCVDLYRPLDRTAWRVWGYIKQEAGK